jgi:ABC-type transport system substrate-binding protein
MSSAQLLPGSMLNGTVTWSPTNNNTGYTSDAYARIVADTARETDPAKQKQLYAQFNDLLLEDSWIAIVSPAVVSYLAAANLRSLTPNYHNSLNLTNSWVDA